MRLKANFKKIINLFLVRKRLKRLKVDKVEIFKYLWIEGGRKAWITLGDVWKGFSNDAWIKNGGVE